MLDEFLGDLSAGTHPLEAACPHRSVAQCETADGDWAEEQFVGWLGTGYSSGSRGCPSVATSHIEQPRVGADREVHQLVEIATR